MHLKSKENRAAKLHRYVKLKAHGFFSVSFPSTNKDETPFFCLRWAVLMPVHWASAWLFWTFL